MHLVDSVATNIVGAQYSKDGWMSFVKLGTPAYTYYIFKPVDCSKPFLHVGGGEDYERWGEDVTVGLK